MSESDKQKPILFYSNACPLCAEIFAIIKTNRTMNNYKLICTDDPSFKMSAHVSSVPTLFAKELTMPIVGEVVKAWVKKNDYFNIPTNNIAYTQSHPTKVFVPNAELVEKAMTVDTDLITLNGNDEGMNRTAVHYDKITQMKITGTRDEINDTRLMQAIQQEKLLKLKNARTGQIDAILQSNKTLKF
jgi:hypothetical protein